MQFRANSKPGASVLIDTRTEVGRPYFYEISSGQPMLARPENPFGTASRIPVMIETPSSPVSFVVDSATERERAQAPVQGAPFEASIGIQEALASQLFFLRNAAVARSSAGHGFGAESDCRFKALRD
jgi:hypothetical protein